MMWSTIRSIACGGVVALAAACGVTETEAGSSSSGTPSECTEVVEGDLEVTDETDLEWLRTVREVRGRVHVRDLAGSNDLSMLSCLEVVGDGLWIQNTQSVRVLGGLERLRAVGAWPDDWIVIEGNQALETLDGLESLEELGSLVVWDNPNLSRLEVNHVKRLGGVRLGWIECVFTGPEGVAMPRGDNPKLTEIDGFEALESGAHFGVYGQTGLVSLDRLVEVSVQQRDASGNDLMSGTFELNSALPLSEINAFYAVRESYPPWSAGLVCGNKDDPNTCECVPGE